MVWELYSDNIHCYASYKYQRNVRIDLKNMSGENSDPKSKREDQSKVARKKNPQSTRLYENGGSSMKCATRINIWKQRSNLFIPSFKVLVNF